MALSLRVELSVYGAAFKFSACAAHTLIGRYVYGKLTIQEFILIGDKALYQSLARELIVSSPDGAVKVIMIASLVVSAEGDVGTFEFDYVNSDGIRTWFPFGIDLIHDG